MQYMEFDAVNFTGGKKYKEPYGNHVEFVNLKRFLHDMSTLQRKSHLCVPGKGIARPQSQFLNSCVCERFIYDT
jgi:hypothetical protein